MRIRAIGRPQAGSSNKNHVLYRFTRLAERHESSSALSHMTMAEDTIAAIATACGRGGIGIVRVSGHLALGIAKRLFQPLQPLGNSRQPAKARTDFAPLANHLHYGHIIDPGSHCLVDEVLIAFMAAPHSYTREDVLEIQSHGGAVILNKLLALVLQCGARLAEPGEFTRRAFMNGRIDLTQAEAVADIICATSDHALHLAADQLSGGLKHRIQGIISAIYDVAAELEARIDFPDDVAEPPQNEGLRQVLSETAIAPIEKLIESFRCGRLIRDGMRVAIAGRPNVGKSSLLNQLLDADKAIVAPIPGTTRDTIEAGINFNGISMWFCDTAGIQESSDTIEVIGIRKSKEAIADADLILVVIDAAASEHPGDSAIFECAENRPILVVVNKIDLTGYQQLTELPDQVRHLPLQHVCALDGTGIGALKGKIYARFVQTRTNQPAEENTLVANARHRECLEEALGCLNRAMSGLDAADGEALVCIDLNEAGAALRKLTGATLDAAVLDRIFQRFCIGK